MADEHPGFVDTAALLRRLDRKAFDSDLFKLEQRVRTLEANQEADRQQIAALLTLLYPKVA